MRTRRDDAIEVQVDRQSLLWILVGLIAAAAGTGALAMILAIRDLT